MCHRRTINTRIKKLHERFLRIVYNIEEVSIVPMYINNLQVEATGMFKVCKNISPYIVGELFQLRNNDYNL